MFRDWKNVKNNLKNTLLKSPTYNNNNNIQKMYTYTEMFLYILIFKIFM